MDIKAFEKEQAKLLRDPEVLAAWLEYLGSFPHVSAYFRSASQYVNQISIINGKKAGSDINLYKLFLETCFNLLRPHGRCGIILQSGVYTDLGTKQLREMLFSQCQISSLFGLSNEKFIFENVHHAQKFCILVFEKGGQTETFEAAFRINPREAVSPKNIGQFLTSPSEHIKISVPLLRRLSPDSLSVMEFKNGTDVRIAEKMLRFPLLGKHIEGNSNLVLTNEFHMTNDSHLFETKPAARRLPLYEGKMIHQFTHKWGEAKYWIDEKKARPALLGKGVSDAGQMLDYQTYRLAFREIASNTNERGMISAVLPKNVFANHKLMLSSWRGNTSNLHLLFCCAVLNSFAFDYQVRQRTTTTISMFTFYQLPVPRLTEEHPEFASIVARAGRLICTTPEFDELARSVGLKDHTEGATDAGERAQLRAELDGIVANLYGLTEAEFAYVLLTFPLVPQVAKDGALNAFRDVEKGPPR